MLAMQTLQTFTRNVRVNGGGRNIGMAQEHLHRTQISPMVEQVRRKRMAQRVG